MISTLSPRAFLLGMLTLLALFGPLHAMSLSASARQPGFFGDAADSDTAAAATATDERLVRGKVVAVDPARNRITLEYRPIPEQFLEGGTRIFDVAQTVALKGLSAGDNVRFDVEREGRRYIVIRLENSN